MNFINSIINNTTPILKTSTTMWALNLYSYIFKFGIQNLITESDNKDSELSVSIPISESISEKEKENTTEIIQFLHFSSIFIV